MKKNIVWIIVGLVILLAISAFVAIKYSPNILVMPAAGKITGQSKSTSSEIIFFYGNGCPHCALVEKFISDNNVDSKVKLDKKEVFSNQDNANLLADKAHSCGLNTDNIGVPFLWDGPTGKCIVGDTDVINYLKAKIGQ
jgi:hypothetical protein